MTALQQQGYEIDLLNIGRDGRIDLEQLEELLRKDTVLVSICGVDSELGTVQPVRRSPRWCTDAPTAACMWMPPRQWVKRPSGWTAWIP